MSIYEWADDIRPAVMGRLKEMCSNEFPYPYEVVGIAVLNAESGEAEYYSILDVDGSVFAIDVMQDISGDIDRQLDDQILKAREIMRAKGKRKPSLQLIETKYISREGQEQ